jgi:hypothetical protein
MATNNMLNSPEPFGLSIGGTNAQLTAVQGAVVYCGVAAMGFTAAGTLGQFLQSQGTGEPVWTTIPGATSWSTVTASTQAAAVNSGYVINYVSGQCVVTLPLTAAIGSKVSIRGLSSGGWSLVANTGQTIQFGNVSSTTAGSWTSALGSDTCDVECIVANTTWALTNCVSTGPTKA